VNTSYRPAFWRHRHWSCRLYGPESSDNKAIYIVFCSTTGVTASMNPVIVIVGHELDEAITVANVKLTDDIKLQVVHPGCTVVRSAIADCPDSESPLKQANY
jgi:hypothetical protein